MEVGTSAAKAGERERGWPGWRGGGKPGGETVDGTAESAGLGSVGLNVGVGTRHSERTPFLPNLSPRLSFGFQFPGGNDNYLTITGPSHPFLSGAEVSTSGRRWGGGLGREEAAGRRGPRGRGLATEAAAGVSASLDPEDEGEARELLSSGKRGGGKS